MKNDIFLTPFQAANEPAGSTIDGYFVNLGKTRRAGVELAAAYRFPAGHSVYAQLRLYPGDLPEPGRHLHDPLE